MGQILCNFYLGVFERDPKTRRIKNYKDPKVTKMEDYFKSTTEPKHTVNIEMAIFGIRNLIRKAVKPRMNIRLTDDVENKFAWQIKIDADWQESVSCEETHNPNFGTTVRFEGVELAADPLCWPYLEIQIDDEERGAFLSF